jgi:hypothetical protein
MPVIPSTARRSFGHRGFALNFEFSPAAISALALRPSVVIIPAFVRVFRG